MKKLVVLFVALSSVALLDSPAAFAGGTWTNVTVTQFNPCGAYASGAPCSVGTGYVEVVFSAK